MHPDRLDMLNDVWNVTGGVSVADTRQFLVVAELALAFLIVYDAAEVTEWDKAAMRLRNALCDLMEL